jgi:DNA-binding response OmpR family regulator
MNANRKRILLFESYHFNAQLKKPLEANGFLVEKAKNEKEAYNLFYNLKYDVCLLDIHRPVPDGFILAQKIRAKDNDIPIIFLVAHATKDDLIEAFRIGADDWIQKPFELSELLVRLDAVLRRSRPVEEDTTSEFTFGKYTFKADKRTLTAGEHAYKLTTKESQLMHLLLLHKNQLVERSFALKKIWLDNNHFTGRSMDVFITKLRKYIIHDKKIEIINVHGEGFKLVVNS